MVGARAPDFECSYKTVIKNSYLAIHYSPGIGGLDSDRLLLLGDTNVSALTLGFWGECEFKDWGGGRGSDFVLLRGFESWEDILLRCVVEPARLRVRVTG